jgi:hypothetical protein
MLELLLVVAPEMAFPQRNHPIQTLLHGRGSDGRRSGRVLGKYAGDVIDGGRFLNDGSPWSFSVVFVLPIAPL